VAELVDESDSLSDDELALIYLRQQTTLERAVQVTGFGYWSGKDVCVEFRPAEPNTGIVFVRCNGDAPKRIPALVANRIEVPRRTNLSCGGASVEMVEHIMAALAGLRVDNCEVWVDSAEMPACDGSSKTFAEALLSAGIVEQHAQRARIVITDITRVGNENSWVEARPSHIGGFSIKYRLDYMECPAIGRQTLEMTVTPETFKQKLAPARTFLLKAEADWLQEQGLGSRVTYGDLLVFDNDGPLENELRYPDECVRHKALDLVGDLALAGCDLVGRITAHRSGHRLNAELVSVLLAENQIVESVRRTA